MQIHEVIFHNREEISQIRAVFPFSYHSSQKGGIFPICEVIEIKCAANDFSHEAIVQRRAVICPCSCS